MSQTITAVYENGVLRPLTPLTLPEHTEVQIVIEPRVPDPADEQRRRFREVLQAAGLIGEPIADPSAIPLAAHERAALADRLAVPGAQPLSEVIIEEREAR